MKKNKFLTAVLAAMLLLTTSCDMEGDKPKPRDSDAPVVTDDVARLFSSDGSDVISNNIGVWYTATDLQSMTDSVMGTVMEVKTKTSAGTYTDADDVVQNELTWGTVFAFDDIDASVNFIEAYGQMTFKIKSDDLTEISVHVAGSGGVIPFSDGEALGDGWYKITVQLNEYVENSDRSVAIWDELPQGEVSTVNPVAFYVTDVMFSGDYQEPAFVPFDGEYLISSAGDAVTGRTIGTWETDTALTSGTDPEYGAVMTATTGVQIQNTVIAFDNINDIDYMAEYSLLSFKIKSADITEVTVEVPGHAILYPFSEEVELEGGWYNVEIPLSDFYGAGGVGTTSLGIMVLGSSISSPISYSITDVAFTEPRTKTSLPAEGGYLYAPGAANTQSIMFSNIWEMGSGASIAAVADTDHDSVLSVSGGGGWGSCAGFVGFGHLASGNIKTLYSSVKFKIKSTTATTIRVGLGNSENSPVTISSGTALSNGWYEITMAMSDIPAPLNSAIPNALLFIGNGDYLITDIQLVQ